MKIETAGMSLGESQTPPRATEACDALVQVQKMIKRDGVIMLILYIIAATLESQVGHIHREYFNLPVGGSETAEMLEKRLIRFAMEFGLVSRDQFESGSVELDFDQFEGKQAIVQIVSRKDQLLQIDFFGVWAVGDPAAPFVPSIEKSEVTNE